MVQLSTPSERPIDLPGTRRALRVAAGIFQGGDKIFLTLAFEFFLGGFEARDARRDFFPLQSEPVLLFGHSNPFESCPASIVFAIGARIGTRRYMIVIVADVDENSTTFDLRGG